MGEGSKPRQRSPALQAESQGGSGVQGSKGPPSPPPLRSPSPLRPSPKPGLLRCSTSLWQPEVRRGAGQPQGLMRRVAEAVGINVSPAGYS